MSSEGAKFVRERVVRCDAYSASYSDFSDNEVIQALVNAISFFIFYPPFFVTILRKFAAHVGIVYIFSNRGGIYIYLYIFV